MPMPTLDASLQPNHSRQKAAPSPGMTTLERNLAALTTNSPYIVESIRDAEPACDLELYPSGESGVITGTYAGVALASARRPITESERLAETVDPKAVGAVVILGFGLGHHVRAITERCRHECLLVVYEPDVALLRAVLERIDHSDWLRKSSVLILTDPEDAASLTASLRRSEGMLALGVRIVEHPPSRARLAESGVQFCDTFARVLAAARTLVVTTFVQSEATCRNFLGNLREYIARPGITDLAGRCAGRPAITVAAGPSLARNIELLKTPCLRDRCVIIAAQTVLKPLLAIGVRPHFVTSLDYHEISARFYEGLTSDDVADTTLIVEPKANPAVVRAYPGPIRFPSESTLDLLLGAEIAGSHGVIRSGSTVAHLSYDLARLLGCDPVILLGQDLGFTDGLYYADGAAIHLVWANELNPFRTLEMFEWERIARHRTQLRTIDSADGPIYTDEQMATYLAQFERMFLEDHRAGRVTVDAGEGGALKANTIRLTLAEAIEQYAPSEAPRLPDLALPVRVEDDVSHRCACGIERVAQVRKDVVRLIQISRRTDGLLERMLDRFDDQPAVNKLIRKAHTLRDEAASLQPAFALVERINQMGVFKRARADREILLTEALSSREIQKRRIERDRINVQWVGDAAEALLKLLEAPMTERRPNPAAPDAQSSSGRAASIASRAEACAKSRDSHRQVTAIIAVDPDCSGLGLPRDLAQPIAGRTALEWTLARLARSRRINHAVLLTPNVERGRRLLGTPISPPAPCRANRPEPFSIEWRAVDADSLHDPAIAAARRWSRTSWRGGIANLSCHDEIMPVRTAARALDGTSFKAGLLVGADWACIDPALCDDAIDRWLESPDAYRMAFTQAPPGLAGIVVGRDLLGELSRINGSTLNTFGGMLGYHPRRPRADPIAQRACAPIDHSIRDASARFIADNHGAMELLETMKDAAMDAGAFDFAAVRANIVSGFELTHIEIELCAGRPPQGCAPFWTSDRDEPHRFMTTATALSILRTTAERHPGAVITLTGSGDPLTHPDILKILDAAHEAGVAGLHVRTPFLTEPPFVSQLLQAPIDILSVDLLANTATSYERIMGHDRFRAAIENIDCFASSRRATSGLALPWIVPRITRCRTSLDEIESFYDKWLFILGAASIDPLPCGASEDRIAPLRLPQIAADRFARETRFIPVTGDAAMLDGNTG